MNAIEIESSTSYDVDTCFLRQLFEEDWVPTNAMRCYLFNIRLNKEEGPVLFCFVLFCFCFVLFCFVLFCFVLFCFVLFCFVLFIPTIVFPPYCLKSSSSRSATWDSSSVRLGSDLL